MGPMFSGGCVSMRKKRGVFPVDVDARDIGAFGIVDTVSSEYDTITQPVADVSAAIWLHFHCLLLRCGGPNVVASEFGRQGFATRCL